MVDGIQVPRLDQGPNDYFDFFRILPALLHPFEIPGKLAGKYRCAHQIPSFRNMSSAFSHPTRSRSVAVWQGVMSSDRRVPSGGESYSRRFTAEYKAGMVRETDMHTQPGRMLSFRDCVADSGVREAPRGAPRCAPGLLSSIGCLPFISSSAVTGTVNYPGPPSPVS